MSQNLIQMQNGAKGFGGQTLFKEAFFSINRDEHVGVIGPNGAGKSTLFKILINQESLDQGQIIRSKELSIGYLSQHDQWSADETGNSFLERVSKIPLWQVKSMGKELLVTEEIFQRPINSLSGGYRMRIKLIGLLGQDPNLMLLDEPTNYLDLETTILLEKFLQNFNGAFLLISHDREFLKRTTDHILEVEAGDFTKFNGNIDDYFEQKELLRSQLESRAQSLADKRKSVLEFVSRFGAKATKAKQAQSRLKLLDKMEVIELKPLQVSAKIKIPPPAHVGKMIVKISEADLGYSEKKILSNVNLEILKGDHIAVVGLNGAGKSTLLKSLFGSINPISGKRELGYQVTLAIFNQHVVEVLNSERTVIESLMDKAHPDVSRQEILDMAGSLLFSGEQINKKISVLSGGEKSRVALGQILLQKVSFLMLDEPTNHLDFQTVEALTQALCNYEGTFVVVSHDRGFVRRISSKILEVSKGQVNLYPGTYDEYIWSLQKSLTFDQVSNEESNSKTNQYQSTEEKFNSIKSPKISSRKELEKKIRFLEKQIQTTETEIAKIENHNSEISLILSSEEVVQQPQKLTELSTQLAKNTERLSQLEMQWVEASTELETLSLTIQK